MQIRKPVLPKKNFFKCLSIFLVKWVHHKVYTYFSISNLLYKLTQPNVQCTCTQCTLLKIVFKKKALVFSLYWPTFLLNYQCKFFMNFVMKSKGNEEKSRVILPSHQLTPPYMCNAERQKRTTKGQIWKKRRELCLFIFFLVTVVPSCPPIPGWEHPTTLQSWWTHL